MKPFVGTSGYAYKPWKGIFYPEHLPDKQMLHYYGERFGTVEINNTFYRMPTLSVLEKWAAEVPAGFKFAIKAPQRITHMLRLKEAEEPVSLLLETVAVLKDRLGPLLFQLPPSFKKDLPLLREFLALLPPEGQAAFEFRHKSWFEDDQAFKALHEHNAALCIAEEEKGFEVPFVKTADWGYLRLRRTDYREGDLKAWADRVRQADWQDVFVFFKHEDEAKAPAFAQRFLELLH